MGKIVVSDLETSSPFPLLRRIDLSQYKWYQDRFNMPPIEKFARKNLDQTELWNLEETFILRYKINGKQIDKVFRESFVFDKASAPKIVRSIVDNDAFIVIIAALNHDADFGLHFSSYEEANEVFFQLIKMVIKRYVTYLLTTDRDKREVRSWYRDSMRQARWYHRGVETNIGEDIYNEINPEDHWNYGKVISTIEDDNGEV